MALCTSDPAAEKAERRCCPLTRVLLMLCVGTVCLCIGFMEVYRLQQGAQMQRQILELQRRLEKLESAASADPQVARLRRAVVDGNLRTIDGVPIILGPYGGRRRPPSEGLRIYETFLAERRAQPTAPSVNYETDDPSIQPHHRSSAVHRPASRFGRVNTNAVIAAEERPARGSPPAYVPPPVGGGGGGGGGSGRGGRRQRCSAAHFEGHISDVTRKSASYRGNYRLVNSNPDSMFSQWRPAAWMRQKACTDEFQLYGGQVTVRTPGFYYLYAQINHIEEHDVNGFEIQVNAQSLVKCITTEASKLRNKTNTCFTGAAIYLNQGDAVSVRDLDPLRHAFLLPDRSFFGLLRISG
ncbi:uncharacterized protein LOC119109379 [Pollicipes pollicipes]|uniref:uncharacterized protein LOC119109379 n=1 Tax=Pollicipes pollicipes TaxID=41117 RepID=UPI001884DD36|nr:uncharacterized protein LOC119109379 [Pollicipes pollicipes]